MYLVTSTVFLELTTAFLGAQLSKNTEVENKVIIFHLD